MRRQETDSAKPLRCARGVLALTLGIYATVVFPADSRLPPEFLACAATKRNGERLACYDRMVELLSAGETVAAGTLPSESAFGMQSQEQPKVASSEQREQLSSVKARVAAVQIARNGMRTIELDNGQVWRQTTGSTNLFLQAGDEVTIMRGAFNSFQMSVPDGRPIRVTRVK